MPPSISPIKHEQFNTSKEPCKQKYRFIARYCHLYSSNESNLLVSFISSSDIPNSFSSLNKIYRKEKENVCHYQYRNDRFLFLLLSTIKFTCKLLMKENYSSKYNINLFVTFLCYMQ